MPHTKGFDSGELQDHFKKHVVKRKTIVAANALEYERLADVFMGGPKAPSTLECRRIGGDVCRLHCKTDEFGVLDKSGTIGSYFKPQVSRHKLASNLHYMCQECRKEFLPGGGFNIV